MVDTPVTLIHESIDGVSAKRYCASCEDRPLKIIDIGGVKIDSCEQCSGIFFDEHEINEFLVKEEKNQKGIGDISDRAFRL